MKCGINIKAKHHMFKYIRSALKFGFLYSINDVIFFFVVPIAKQRDDRLKEYIPMTGNTHTCQNIQVRFFAVLTM